MKIPVGAVVDRYRVEGFIGRGGAGSVYRVRHETLGIQRALKVVHLDVPELREQLLEEGRIQARLSHPNLVQVHDAFEVDGDPALLMDLVEGPSLQQVLNATRLSRADSERLFREILDGLEHAHEHGVIHRDLKPANVLLAEVEGVSRARVVDFGIARLLDEERTGHTGPTGWLGTPEYMAPEQLRGSGSRDRRVDIYALGVLLYRLLGGRHPFDVADPIARLRMAEARDWAPLEELSPGLPPALLRAVEGALEPKPALRIATVSELRAVLDGGEWRPGTEVASEGGPPPSSIDSEPDGGTPGGAPARSRWPWVALATSLAIALGGVGWAALQERSRVEALTDELAAAELMVAARGLRRPAEALALARASVARSGEGELPSRLMADLLARGGASHVYVGDGEPLTSVAMGATRVVTVDHDGMVTVSDRQSGELLGTIDTGVYRARWVFLSEQEDWVSVRGSISRGEAERAVLAWSLPDGRPLLHAPEPPERMEVDPSVEVVVATHTSRLATTSLNAWSIRSGEHLWTRDYPAGKPLSLEARHGLLIVSGAGPSELVRLVDGEVLASPVPGINTRVVSPAGLLFTSLADVGFEVRPIEGGDALVREETASEPIVHGGADGLGVRDVHGNGWWYQLDPTLGGRVSLPGRASAIAVPSAEAAIFGTREGRIVESWRGQSGLATWMHEGRVTEVVADQGGIVSVALSGQAIGQPWRSELLGLIEERAAGPTATASWGGASGMVWREPEGSVAWTDLDPRPRRVDPDGDGVTKLAIVAPDGGVGLVGSSSLDWIDTRGERLSYQLSPRHRLQRSIGTFPLPSGVMVASWNGLIFLRPGEVSTDLPLSQVSAVVLSEDGALAYASYGKDTTIAVVETSSGSWLSTLSIPGTESEGIAGLSKPTAGHIYAGTWGGQLFGWELESGDGRLIGDLGAAVMLLVADGTRLATGSWDGMVRLWDLESGTLEWAVEVPEGARSLAWLPGDLGLAVGTTEGTLQVYSMAGELVGTRVVGEAAVAALWLREDDTLALHTADGRWQRWRPEALVEGFGSLERSGALTNLRVCRDSQTVVPVVPFPHPESVWAPEGACAVAEEDEVGAGGDP